MTTTAITQGIRCGNRKVHGTDRAYHANSAEVRACYEVGAFAAKPVSAPPAPTSQPRNVDEARNAAAQRLANQDSPFFPRSKPEYPASPRQREFLADLGREVITEELLAGFLRHIEIISAAEARELITNMIVMRDSKRKMEAEAAAKLVPAKVAGRGERATLMHQVMGDRKEGNFAIIDDSGKTRFYRISKRGNGSKRPGTWKIQERVTDMLLPRADSLLVKVCTEVMAMGGPKASGELFADRLHRCYRCGASLTDDTGNPYYAVGLGPECGSK